MLGIAVDNEGYVYTGSRDETVRKLDSEGDEQWSYTEHDDMIWAVAVDREGNVYTGSRDNTARKLDSDGNEVWSYWGHSGTLQSIAADGEGNAYTASLDETVRKLDSDDGSEVWRIEGYTTATGAIAVDPGLYATYDNQCQPVID